jgi:transcription initiation factor TFIID TATA-box-binding protein
MQSLEIKPRSEIKIVNVVCTTDLKQKIDLTNFNNFQYLSANLDRYCCGYVKTKKMIGRVSIFQSGKLISIGTKSTKFSFNELRIACNLLKKHKLIKSFKIEPKIRNIVATVDLQRKIDLEKIALQIPKIMYEPEQFPGLILRLIGSNVALIFASGKAVLTGAKSYEDLNSMYFQLNNIL